MDDDYPSGEKLAAIDNWQATLGELLEYVRKLWSPHGLVQVSVNAESRMTIYSFVTGGWSGNESLIYALNNNTMANILAWESTHRGGLHVYAASPQKLQMRLGWD